MCRYLAPAEAPYQWKRATPKEVTQLLGAGISIVLVYETAATRARGGGMAGRWDVLAAREHARQLGLASAPIYFAVDFDATESDQTAINSYLSGAALILGRDKVGVYGGYHVVKRCLDARVCKYAWQTYAWSGGNLDKRAHLYQYSNGHKLAGVSCDYDKSLARDFGQSPRPKPLIPVPPKAQAWYEKHGPRRKPAWFFAALKEYARRLRK